MAVHQLLEGVVEVGTARLAEADELGVGVEISLRIERGGHVEDGSHRGSAGWVTAGGARVPDISRPGVTALEQARPGPSCVAVTGGDR